MIAAKKERRPIIWQPLPKQREVLEAPERECLYGGALAGGKSDCLLVCALSQIDNGKHRAIYFRRSFPQLRSAIERSHELYRPCGGVYNVQTSQWTFPSGAKIEFAFLDSDSDKWRYAGRSFNCILWDELCEWPNDSAYVYMLSRLRTTKGSGLRLEVRSSANPLGSGSFWVKSRFNVPDNGTASECVDPDTGFHRRFIPARISDNVHLLGSDYERQLQSLPSAQRKALLEGRWDAVAGAIFDEFDDRLHICDEFPIPFTWDIYRCADDGFRAPFACYWLCHDRDGADCVYVARELYATALTPVDAARAVRQIDFSLPIDIGGEVVSNDAEISGVIDSASFADTGMGGSRGSVMNEHRCGWKACEKPAGSIFAGLSAIHSRSQQRADGSVGLKIFRGRCPNLTRELRGLVYDPRNVEQYEMSCSDHGISALRYGLLYKKPWTKVARVRWAH